MRRIFLSLVVVVTIAELSSTTESDLLASRSYCGYQHVDDYMRDNDEISIHEFPWMAQLLYNEIKKVLCSGSLISRRYILTAAHCIKDNTALVGVRLGDFRLPTEKDCVVHSQFGNECADPLEEFEIESIIPHPDYKYPSLEHDIGLIRLSKDVVYSEYIRPICLHSRGDELKVGEQLTTSGWGYVSNRYEQTETKKKISTSLISRKDCTKYYTPYRMSIFPYHMCTLFGEETSCQGDSGAPLMRAINKQWEQFGVLSFGKCFLDVPTVYVNVTHYLDWIRKNVRE